jgi:hypothetical protein
MDFGAGREGEDEVLNIIGEGTGGEGDGSEFLNESGEGMEEDSYMNQKQMMIARMAHKGLDMP